MHGIGMRDCTPEGCRGCQRFSSKEGIDDVLHVYMQHQVPSPLRSSFIFSLKRVNRLIPSHGMQVKVFSVFTQKYVQLQI